MKSCKRGVAFRSAFPKSNSHFTLEWACDPLLSLSEIEKNGESQGKSARVGDFRQEGSLALSLGRASFWELFPKENIPYP